MATAAISHAPASPHVGISTPLTKAEARDLTDRINATAGKLCVMLYEAHERRAWEALGYSSWREYATAELQVSQSRAYQVLDHGRITMALAGAVTGDEAGDFSTKVEISERAARDIKPILPEVVEEVKERVAAGAAPADAVEDVVTAGREITQAMGRGLRNGKPEPEPHPEYGADDMGETDLAAELEAAVRENRDLQAQLESLAATDKDREILKLHSQVAQLNANHQGTLRTLAEMRAQVERAHKILKPAAKLLRVEDWREIPNAIKRLVVEA